ncbi:MAG: hypothetical protein J6S69_03835, partial [Proteobacteria bacterium]|nr:hypothetical protein [Pseudomonadota bacterium]
MNKLNFRRILSPFLMTLKHMATNLSWPRTSYRFHVPMTSLETELFAYGSSPFGIPQFGTFLGALNHSYFLLFLPQNGCDFEKARNERRERA